jgi:aryl-alcohol dehydrogenase-like predicted oxidoreductase
MNLGINYIDLSQIHDMSNFKTYETVLDPNGPFGVIKAVKRAGQIKGSREYRNVDCLHMAVARYVILQEGY